MQQRRVGWVQHIADMVVARDLADPEETFAVRAPVARLQVPLIRQERGALHEEHRERRHGDIGDRIGGVHAPALVGEPLEALAQAADEGIEALHPDVESYLGRVANRGFRGPMLIVPNCGNLDSVGVGKLSSGWRHQTLRGPTGLATAMRTH